MLKILLVPAVLGLLWFLHRRFHPSRFGLLFGLFCLYLPLNLRLPLDVLPMVNGITGFLVALALTFPYSQAPLKGRSGGYLAVVCLFIGISLAGFALTWLDRTNATGLATLFKRWIEPGLFGLLALGLVRLEDQKFTVSCMMAGYALVAVQAVREGLDYGPLKRIPGLLGQANETATFLAAYAPVLISMALQRARGPVRWGLLGMVILAGWGLVPTESRASMIGYTLGIIAMLFSLRRPGLGLLAVAALVTVWQFPSILPERVVARFESTLVDSGEPDTGVVVGREDLEPSALQRVRNWTASFRAVASHPFGIGFNQFKEQIGGYGGIEGLDAHNFFLLTAVEFGVAGFLIVLVFFLKVGVDAWAVNRKARDPFLQALGGACFAVTIVMVVVNLFGSRLAQEQPSAFFWMLGALAARGRDGLVAEPPAGAPATEEIVSVSGAQPSLPSARGAEPDRSGTGAGTSSP